MEFQVNGQTYLAANLSAMEAFHVARKLSVVLLGLGSLKSAAAEATPQRFAKAIIAMSGGLSREEAESAINACLAKVQRKAPDGRGWSPIVAPQGTLMFADIGMGEMLEIVWHVLRENRLDDFFVDPPSSTGAMTAASAS